MSHCDGRPVRGDGAGVAPGIFRPHVGDPQVVAAGQAVPRVRAHHQIAGSQHVGSVLPNHHELAEMLRVALEDDLVTDRRPVSAGLRGDDGADGDCPVVRLVGEDARHQEEGRDQLGAPHLCGEWLSLREHGAVRCLCVSVCLSVCPASSELTVSYRHSVARRPDTLPGLSRPPAPPTRTSSTCQRSVFILLKFCN